MFKSIKAAVTGITAIALTGTAASAGGLSDQIVEAPIVEDAVEVAPATGSLPGWVIPAAIVAVLIGIAASSNGSSSDETDDTPEEPADDGGKEIGNGDNGAKG
jgi:hypothetical protein